MCTRFNMNVTLYVDVSMVCRCLIRLFKPHTFCTFRRHCHRIEKTSDPIGCNRNEIVSYVCTRHISKRQKTKYTPNGRRSPKRSLSCASLHRFTTRITALPASRVDTNMTAACRSSSPAVTCASAVSISSSIGGGLIARRGATHHKGRNDVRDYAPQRPKRRARIRRTGRCERTAGTRRGRLSRDARGRRLFVRGRPRPG